MLAGSRGGEDPLAAVRGGSHRALLEVAGVPMLLRVVRALRSAPGVGPIAVSIDEPEVLRTDPELGALVAAGELTRLRSLASPSRSVRDALARGPAGAKTLVATADCALLTPEIIECFIAGADAADSDVAIGLVAEQVVRARHPTAVRTYLRFRDGGYSGANLFAFRTPQAALAAEFWVNAEQFRKRPWRLASVFGPAALALFALRRLTLDAAITRASGAIGCSVQAVRLPFAEAAIDVDRPSDLTLAARILAERQS